MPESKSAWLAGVLGFVLGPLGLGLYFASWKDFFLALLVGLVLFGVSVNGGLLGALVVASLMAGLGVWRVKDSEKRRSSGRAGLDSVQA